MTKLILLISALVLSACILYGTLTDSKPNVIELTGENFNQYIEENKFVFVKFYAPWCKHCKNLIPEYEKLAKSSKSVLIAKLDATKYKEIADSQGISGFPTLRMFKSGATIDYNGQRDGEHMLKWLNRQTKPPALNLNDEEQFEVFQSSDYISRAVYHAMPGDDKFLDIFKETAENSDFIEFGFGYYTGEVPIVDYSQKVHSISIYQKGQATITKDVDSELDGNYLKNWLDRFGYPHLENLVLNENFINRINRKRVPTIFFIHENKNLEFLRQIAEKFHTKAIITEVEKSVYPELAESWGATGNVFPTAFISLWKDGKPEFYIWNEDLVFTDGVESWIKNCLETEECPSYMKSEPIPTENNEPVFVVVGKTFKDVVHQDGKHVLIEVYAPWCKYCKKIAPIYEDLALKLKPYSNKILIAKIDGTKNSFNIDVQAYPKIMLFKAGDKENPIHYEGENTISGLTAFLNEHTGLEINLDLKDEL